MNLPCKGITRIVTREAEREFSNHPHANKTDQNVLMCTGRCTYSLIVLWPHTDECDRTVKRGEGNKSHGTNTFEQIKTKAVGGEAGE